MTNTVKASDGMEVYVHKIFSLADEYVKEQLDGDATKVPEYFRDLIFYISDRLERVDHADIETLDKLFDAFVRLCTRYKKLPTLEAFSWLVKINRTTFGTWISGTYRSSTGHSDTAQKWFDVCKSFTLDELSNSKFANPNLIFVSKAAYGLRETSPAPVIEQPRRYMRADEPIYLSTPEERKKLEEEWKKGIIELPPYLKNILDAEEN
jgi:hypothetical protein